MNTPELNAHIGKRVTLNTTKGPIVVKLEAIVRQYAVVSRPGCIPFVDTTSRISYPLDTSPTFKKEGE